MFLYIYYYNTISESQKIVPSLKQIKNYCWRLFTMNTIEINKLMSEYSYLHEILSCLRHTDHLYEDLYADIEMPEGDYDRLCYEIERIETELQELEDTNGIAIISDKIIIERIARCDGWINAYEKFIAEGEIKEGDPMYNDPFIEEQKVLKAMYEAELNKRGK